MKLVSLDSLFTIMSGNDYELNSLDIINEGINFVSRTRKNNGISAKVKKTDIEPFQGGIITVALSSASVLFAFLQDEPFYTGYHVACLLPIKKMSKQEKLFYCMCITANRYKYNFGRQANKTIHSLLVPAYEEIPDYVNKTKIMDIDNINEKFSDNDINVNRIKYGEFAFHKIFKNIVEEVYEECIDVNLVSAQTTCNGVKEIINTNSYIKGNKITITSNGINTGTAFYQENAFVTQDSIAFELKNYELNKYIALYLVTIINCNKCRFNYGRKSGKARLEKLTLRLPQKDDETPDYEFMEKYIKTLQYSKYI